MISRRTALLSLPVLLVSLGASCDASDDSGSGGSSVEGSKPLASLTAEENQALCKFSERTYKGSLGSEQEYCTANALFGAANVDACEQYRDQCLEDSDYDNDRNEDWHCEDADVGYFVDEESDCDATVSELEACIREQAEDSRELTQYTCDDVEEAEVTLYGPACTKLTDKCPDTSF
jgi:hypothetical protein